MGASKLRSKAGKLYFWVLTIVFCLAFQRARAEEPIDITLSTNTPIPGFEFTNAFGELRFEQPIAILSPPGETNRLFVVERKGVIAVITNLASPTRSVFLDLSASTESSYEEMGLLGLAFHPGFATNGYFFTYRTRFNFRLLDELSRFQVSSEDTSQANPASELTLISQIDEDIHHNGGGLGFGPDGYLYLAIGESSPWHDNASDFLQNIDKGFFGSLIRIDVDKRPESLPPNPRPGYSTNYAVPADNPWIGATEFQGRKVDPSQVRTELYAIGLRQPFRFSFDSQTGDLFLGDVGESTYEEINIIHKGGNYGWPFREALQVFDPTELTDTFEAPTIYYHHGSGSNNIGSAVMGGVVCRGVDIPLLEGAYVFGDFVSGNIWMFNRGAGGSSVSWIGREMAVSSFGQNPADGSLLIANVASGSIRKLVYHPPPETGIPSRLSDTQLFADTASLTAAAGLLPFDVNVTFWSDNAVKRRWFSLPANSQMTFSDEGNWGFPSGTIWVKHFDLEMTKGDPTTAKRIETRVLMKTADGVEGYTYRWGESTNDATLVSSEGMDESFVITDNGAARTQIWHYPARGECQSCHTAAAGYALGFNTAQLNKTVNRDGKSINQLDWLANRGCLDRTNLDSTTLRQLATATDTTQPIAHRVKSYLAANCAACHLPEGPAMRMRWDPRISTPMSQSGLIGGVPIIGYYMVPEEAIISPQQPDLSLLYLRVAGFDPFLIHMPPLATSETNQQALALLSEFIFGLGINDWAKAQMGADSPLEGSVHHTTNSMVVGGAGIGIDDHFSYSVSLTNNSQIVAHIKSLPWAPPGFGAGLELRAGTNAGSAGAWLLRRAGRVNEFLTRSEDSAPPVSQTSGTKRASWQRLVRQDARVLAFESVDGISWNFVGENSPVDLPATFTAGLAVSSGTPWRYATVEFDQLQTMSVALSVSDSVATLPKTISLLATVATNNTSALRVDFLADGAMIGSTTESPWQYNWTNAIAGAHDIVAVAVDSLGLAITSAPVHVQFSRKPSAAAFISESANDNGIWANQFGSLGYVIPLLGTNLPSGAVFEMSNATATNSLLSVLVPGLDNLLGGILKSAWESPNAITWKFALPTELPYRLTLYVAPYLHSTVQNIYLSDAATGTRLDARRAQDDGRGFFITAIVRGPIQVRIETQNQFGATLSGIFADPLLPPVATLQASTNVVTLPESIILKADAYAEGQTISSVQFWDGNVLLGADTQPPYVFTWTNILAGTHHLKATAIGDFGLSSDSDTLEIKATLPAANASFIKTDTTTLGDWTTLYGSDGYVIPGLAPALPTGAVFNMNGTLFIWASSTDDPSGLQQLDRPDRYAAVQFASWSDGMQLDLIIPDGQSRQLAFYFIDSPDIRRSALIRILDGATGNLLVEKATDPINVGIYYVFQAQGPLHIEIRPMDNWEPIFGGLFLGGPVSAQNAWWMVHFHQPLSEISAVWDADPDHDGRPNLLEYALGSDPNAADPGLLQAIQFDGENISVTIPLGGDAPANCKFYLERSADLTSWKTLDGDAISIQPGSLQFRAPANDAQQGFFRLRAEFVEP